jgi:hypothetical protein
MMNGAVRFDNKYLAVVRMVALIYVVCQYLWNKYQRVGMRINSKHEFCEGYNAF